MQRGGRPEDFQINASHALEVSSVRISPTLLRRPAMIRPRQKANGSSRRFLTPIDHKNLCLQQSFREMAMFDGKQFHSSLETSALLGSTSRGAALCEGAAGLRNTDHRAPETRSRIGTHTIASCVTAGVRTNCGRKRVYARLRCKCVALRANGRGGGVRHCPHDMMMPLACPISSLRYCFVWAICSSCRCGGG
jgi:hypothetical protein